MNWQRVVVSFELLGFTETEHPVCPRTYANCDEKLIELVIFELKLIVFGHFYRY